MGSYVSLLRVEYLHKLFGIILHKCVCSPLFIHLYQYGLMGIRFVLRVIIQCYFTYLLLKLFQLRPLGALQFAPVFLWCTPSLWTFFLYLFLSTFLFSDSTRCSRLVLHMSWTSSRMSVLCFFLTELYSVLDAFCLLLELHSWLRDYINLLCDI